MSKHPESYALAFHSKFRAAENKHQVERIIQAILDNFPQVGNLKVYYSNAMPEDKFYFYREYDLTDFKVTLPTLS